MKENNLTVETYENQVISNRIKSRSDFSYYENLNFIKMDKILIEKVKEF